MISPDFTLLLLFFMQFCVLRICGAIFRGRDLFFFVEAHNSIYLVNVNFFTQHLHINHPIKRLQNYLICLIFPFCGVVNVEVGEGGNFIFTKYIL